MVKLLRLFASKAIYGVEIFISLRLKKATLAHFAKVFRFITSMQNKDTFVYCSNKRWIEEAFNEHNDNSLVDKRYTKITKQILWNIVSSEISTLMKQRKLYWKNSNKKQQNEKNTILQKLFFKTTFCCWRCFFYFLLLFSFHSWFVPRCIFFKTFHIAVCSSCLSTNHSA